MANPEHLAKLKEGVEAWNKWREENLEVKPNLKRINLKQKDLSGINLSNTILDNSDLSESNFSKANLASTRFNSTILRGAIFHNSIFDKTDFSNADLTSAYFEKARLFNVSLTRANLSSANLKESQIMGGDLLSTTLVKTDISRAAIYNTKIYGISVWSILKTDSNQSDLIITPPDESIISVDDLEVAQFIYLLLDNKKIRNVIETVSSKSVLILGRFSTVRKGVLDTIREELRKQKFLPILFDFEKPATRDLTETISILAKLSRFVIVDLTDPKAVPHELSQIIPHMPNLPVIPIIVQGQEVYGMFEHWKLYQWVLPVFEYESEEHLIENLVGGVIDPAERKVREIRNR